MTFYKFSEYLSKLEATSSRLEMTAQLADLYRALSNDASINDASEKLVKNHDEIVHASYLMQGTLVPQFESLEFQLSIKMVLRVLAQIEQELSPISVESQDLFGQSISTELSETAYEKVTKEYKQIGDIGNFAFELLTKYAEKNQTNFSLSINDVFEKLVKIAKVSGEGSQEEKVNLLLGLFKKLEPLSSKFVARIIIGKLRLGFSIQTIIDGLSVSVVGSKNHHDLLEECYQKKADIGILSKEYLALANTTKDETALAKLMKEKYSVTSGIPVVPALCQRLNTAQEIIDKMGTVLAEPKYDGLRLQIHFKKTVEGVVVKAFTRNLEDATHMFPELNNLVKDLKCESCILDSEAIGYKKDTDELLPFQETITRKRKHDVLEQSEKVPIRFYVFDCLEYNGESLIDQELLKRKAVLHELFEDRDYLKFSEYIQTSDPILLREFHEEKLSLGLEGVVIKKTDSVYQSGRKGWSWVKIKEEEGNKGKLKDTLDVVVMGYYFGRGKRAGFGIGAFLVGVLDDGENIKTIAKIGTGITDEVLKILKEKGDELSVPEKPANYFVNDALKPDVYMRPELVVEVAADELTNSPNHTAGLALRFPRLVKFRNDKNWTDATKVSELSGF